MAATGTLLSDGEKGGTHDTESGKYFVNEYAERSRKVASTDGGEISYPTRECVGTLGEFDSAEEAQRARLEVYVERERKGAALPGTGDHATELLVQNIPGDRVARPGAIVVRSRVDVAPEPCGEPGLRAFARHQGFHYMERWPVVRLVAGLGQPEERIACRAVVVTPNGLMIVRKAHPDEKAATDEARDAGVVRDLRLQSAVREHLAEQGCSGEICRMPVHVMTVGTEEPTRPFEPSAVLKGASEALNVTVEGSSVRCQTSDPASLATWELAVGQAKCLSPVVTDQVKDALMPDLPICRSESLLALQALSYAVGQSEVPLVYEQAPSDRVAGVVRAGVCGESAALRTLVRASLPAETVSDLSPVVADDVSDRKVAKAFSHSVDVLRSRGLFAPDFRTSLQGRPSVGRDMS